MRPCRLLSLSTSRLSLQPSQLSVDPYSAMLTVPTRSIDAAILRLAFWLASWPTWLVSSSVKTSWLSSPKDSLRAPLFLWTKFSMSFLFLEKPQDWWNSLCRWPPQNLVRLKILVDWPTHDKVWFCRNGVWCYVAIKHIVYSKVSPFSTQGLHIFSMSQWSKYIFSYFIIPIVIPGVGSYCPGWRKWLCVQCYPSLPTCLPHSWPGLTRSACAPPLGALH